MLKTFFWNSNERRFRLLYRLGSLCILIFLLFGIVIALEEFLSVNIWSNRPHPSKKTESLECILNSSLIIIGVLLCAKIFDRRKLSDFGITIKLKWWIDLLFGFILGAAVITVSFLIEYGLGYVEIILTFQTIAPARSFISELFWPLLMFLFVALNEELLDRGYILKNVAEGFLFLGKRLSIILAIVFSSFIFTLWHVKNYYATTDYLIGIFIFGLVMAFSRLSSGRISIAIGFHFSFNLFLVNVFGSEIGPYINDETKVFVTTYLDYGFLLLDPPIHWSFVILNGLQLFCIPIILLWSRWRNGKWINGDLCVYQLSPLHPSESTLAANRQDDSL